MIPRRRRPRFDPLEGRQLLSGGFVPAPLPEVIVVGFMAPPAPRMDPQAVSAMPVGGPAHDVFTGGASWRGPSDTTFDRPLAPDHGPDSGATAEATGSSQAPGSGLANPDTAPSQPSSDASSDDASSSGAFGQAASASSYATALPAPSSLPGGTPNGTAGLDENPQSPVGFELNVGVPSSAEYGSMNATAAVEPGVFGRAELSALIQASASLGPAANAPQLSAGHVPLEPSVSPLGTFAATAQAGPLPGIPAMPAQPAGGATSFSGSVSAILATAGASGQPPGHTGGLDLEAPAVDHAAPPPRPDGPALAPPDRVALLTSRTLTPSRSGRANDVDFQQTPHDVLAALLPRGADLIAEALPLAGESLEQCLDEFVRQLDAVDPGALVGGGPTPVMVVSLGLLGSAAAALAVREVVHRRAGRARAVKMVDHLGRELALSFPEMPRSWSERRR